MMPLLATAGALVKLAGGKLQKGESGEGSTARGSLLGTTPHFSRSFSYTEGTMYGECSSWLQPADTSHAAETPYIQRL
jgi:hypothetical protein